MPVQSVPADLIAGGLRKQVPGSVSLGLSVSESGTILFQSMLMVQYMLMRPTMYVTLSKVKRLKGMYHRGGS